MAIGKAKVSISRQKSHGADRCSRWYCIVPKNDLSCEFEWTYNCSVKEFVEQCSEETVLFNLNNCQELSHGELDLVILTSIQGFTRSDPVGGKRNRSPQSSFFFQSKPICKDMFLHFFLFQAFLLNYVEENTITLLRQK